MTSNPPKSFRLLVHNLPLDLQAPPTDLLQLAAKRLSLPTDALVSCELVRKSLDARKRPTFVCSALVTLNAPLKTLPTDVVWAPEPPISTLELPKGPPPKVEHILVIGSGPAGLFAALSLAISGQKVTLVDRGNPVESRAHDVSRLMNHASLNPDSNICFGEGGAGTFSDGKLTTRIRDHRLQQVLQTMVDLGAPEEILIHAKPHLGTNRLIALSKAFRKRLLDLGCDVRFLAHVRELILVEKHGTRRATGVRLQDGTQIDADRIILAVGHSARDLYLWAAQNQVAMQPKPFAIGYRVEHPQALINSIQYRQWASLPNLPAADYRLTANFGKGSDHRGVYSFCMCPGGKVVAATTEPDGVCVNGMSYSSRSGHFANSALVVTIRPKDFASFGALPGLGQFGGRLDGLLFQQEAEKRAFRLGGGGFVAPAQRLHDFQHNASPSEVGQSSYKPGIQTASLSGCYPDWVNDHLRLALTRFNQTMRGFLTEDATLIGVETRTSAPVTLLRDPITFQSSNVLGLYPCGEGSGYGGGIVSAAIDGIKVAERIREELWG